MDVAFKKYGLLLGTKHVNLNDNVYQHNIVKYPLIKKNVSCVAVLGPGGDMHMKKNVCIDKVYRKLFLKISFDPDKVMRRPFSICLYLAMILFTLHGR